MSIDFEKLLSPKYYIFDVGSRSKVSQRTAIMCKKNPFFGMAPTQSHGDSVGDHFLNWESIQSVTQLIA